MSSILYRYLISNLNFKYLVHDSVKEKCRYFLRNNSPVSYFVSCSYFSSEAPTNQIDKNNKETSPSDKIKERKIEATKYYNSNITDEDDFEKTFWEIYEKKRHEQQEMYKPYPDRIRYKKVYNDPFRRTVQILKDDILEFFGKLKFNPVVSVRKNSDVNSPFILKKEEIFPSHSDIVIIGGGLVGTSIAYHLQERARDGLRIVVIEKDLSYSKASSVLSLGGIRQQFSIPENIMLSKYGMDFLQQAKNNLTIDKDDPPRIDVNFNGYLTLASERGYPQLLENYQLQRDYNSFVKILTKDQLKSTFPWIRTDGIEAGIYGTQREGWFDPWSLLLALNHKTKSLGTQFVNGTVSGSGMRSLDDYVIDEDRPSSMKQIINVEVTLPDGEKRDIKCAVCVIAAGAWSKEVGLICGVGTATEGIRSISIPVEPRKRFVYCVKSENGPGLNCPVVIDATGAYFRREGLADSYLCGRAPQSDDEEPSTDDLSVDHSHFEENVWPIIAHRCPSFESLKMQSSWAGYYDYNTFDQNGIIGRHPMYSNLYIATGFSGHGIQQAAGAGKVISELILDAELKTINVERLGFERLVFNQPLRESCLY